jgi:glycosyltransferase involved in cell wall biosynthesis
MRETIAGARLLVYPSYYEGFGLPVIDALALGKPVITLQSELNAELEHLLGDSKLHLIQSLAGLNEAVDHLWNDPGSGQIWRQRRWREAANEYVATFRDLLSDGVDTARLRCRWEALRSLSLVAGSRAV